MDDGRWIYATAIRQLKRKSLCYFLQLYFNWAFLGSRNLPNAI